MLHALHVQQRRKDVYQVKRAVDTLAGLLQIRMLRQLHDERHVQRIGVKKEMMKGNWRPIQYFAVRRCDDNQTLLVNALLFEISDERAYIRVEVADRTQVRAERIAKVHDTAEPRD